MSKLTNLTKNSVDFEGLAAYALLNTDQDVVKYVEKFGQNVDIDTSATEDIWSPGGNKVYLEAAETLNIVSSSVNDTNAGTGAWNVAISGIDANYDLIEDFVVLNGTTNVVTNLAFLDVSRIVVYQAGSLEENAGEITATSTGTAVLVAAVEPSDSITQMSHYTVPAGYSGFMLCETSSVYKADGSGTRQGEISMEVKGVGQTAWVKSSVLGLSSNTHTHRKKIPLYLPEKARIKYRGNAGANNTAMSISYEILLIKNTELL